MIVTALILFAGHVVFASGGDYFQDIQQFRRQSLSLKVSESQLEAASALRTSKRLFWTPSLSASASQQETWFNADHTRSDSVGLNANLNLFRGFRDLNAMSSADAGFRSAELANLNSQLAIEVKASDLIFKKIYLKQSLSVQKDFLKMKEESLKIVQEKYRSGRSPLQEVRKFEVDLSQARIKVRESELEFDRNRMEIETQFVETVKTEVWPFEESDAHFANGSAQPSNKQSRSPVLDEKFWQMKSQESIWKGSRNAHWPSLDLSVRYSLSPMADRSNRELMTFLEFSLPLWSRYETTATAQSAYAGYLAAQVEFEVQEKQDSLNRNFLDKKLILARESLKEAKRNLQRSRDLYQDYLKSFRAGRLSSNDLFLEQNRLLESESNLSASQLQYHQALVEVCVLKGESVTTCLSQN